MKTKTDYSTRTETITGVAVKDVRFNIAVNMYLGMVYDEKSYRADKWTTCTWKKTGNVLTEIVRN